MAGTGRVYVSGFNSVTSGVAVQDILSILAGAANGVELHYTELNASGVTAAAELNVRLKRFSGATITAGSGGTAPAMYAVDENDTKAATAVVRANDTTQSTTTGTNVSLIPGWWWNVLLPFQYMPAPEDRCIISAGDKLILDFATAPLVAVTFSGFIKWREIP
jgi:hypothetical protein